MPCIVAQKSVSMQINTSSWRLQDMEKWYLMMTNDYTEDLIKHTIGYSPTQLSHKLQCDALGGLNILQVKQYFSLITWPLITTSLVLGGGL